MFRYHNFSLCPFYNGHVGCFCVLATVHNAALNITPFPPIFLDHSSAWFILTVSEVPARVVVLGGCDVEMKVIFNIPVPQALLSSLAMV